MHDMTEYNRFIAGSFQLICDHEISYPDYSFTVVADARGSIYLQGHYAEADIHTHEIETQSTRRWLISPYMTKSEFVLTVFKCVITSMEHRVREHFLYKGYNILSPHYDVDALIELHDRQAFDVRPKSD